MKKLFASILLCTCFHVSAQRSEPFSTWSFGTDVASSIKEVNVNTVNGDITVIGAAVSGVTVEMFISGNSPEIRRRNRSDEEIRQELEKSYRSDLNLFSFFYFLQ
jgi:hypothetical protein